MNILHCVEIKQIDRKNNLVPVFLMFISETESHKLDFMIPRILNIPRVARNGDVQHQHRTRIFAKL